MTQMLAMHFRGAASTTRRGPAGQLAAPVNLADRWAREISGDEAVPMTVQMTVQMTVEMIRQHAGASHHHAGTDAPMVNARKRRQTLAIGCLRPARARRWRLAAPNPPARGRRDGHTGCDHG